MDRGDENPAGEWAERRSSPYPQTSEGDSPGRAYRGNNYVGQAANVNMAPNHGVIHQTVTVQHGNYLDLTARLNPILDASHTRNLKTSPPHSRCFPGTRREFIAIVLSWAKADLNSNEPHIVWIYGYAGCGKSAICQAVAEQLADAKLLAASFFFFRGAGERCRISRFITTIASDIAAAVPGMSSRIEKALRKEPGLLSMASTSIRHQFFKLILKPLRKATASWSGGPLVVVLDGVDECEDRDEVATFIEEAISFFITQPHSPLRFIIASRVEDHIYRELHSSEVRLLNLVDYTSDTDIAKALDVAIEKGTRGRVMASNPSWPQPRDKEMLVKNIGGSYIFLTTIVKFLFAPARTDGLTPMERLPGLLKMKPQFDGLYTEILQSCTHFPSFLEVLSTIALAFDPLSVVQIAELLNIKTFNVTNVLIHLHAIIQVPDDDRTPIILWHTSLRDFLCTETRSKQFYASPRHHRRLAFSATRKAASGHPSPLLKYSQQYAIKHLSKFVETGYETDTFGGGGDAIIPLLEEPVFGGGRTGNSRTELVPQTALGVACTTKDWKLVRTLVNTGRIDINARFTAAADGLVALNFACLRSEVDMISFLLDRGADPNVVSKTDSGSLEDATPLFWAVTCRNIDLVKKVLACGADPNIRSLHEPARGAFSKSALHICAEQKVGWMATRGLPSTLEESTSTMVEIGSLLLEQGADVNIKDGRGRTPLHYAAYSGLVKLAEHLLGSGADPNIKDGNGWTPLHEACTWGQVEAAECLLDHNADPSIKNDLGETALRASLRWESSVTEMLIGRGIKE